MTTAKQRFLFVLALALLILGLVTTYTGTVLAFFVPRGGQGGSGRWATSPPLPSPLALGLARDELRSIHTWTSLTLAALTVGHILLNWRWILAMIRRLGGPPRS